jgi:hypothetical protein
MGKQRKTEEQLKADIFSIYSSYLNDPSPDRRQVHFAQICEAVISWCTDYLNIKANEMGIEIYNAIQRLVKDNNARVPKDESGFFKYLKRVLDNAKNEYYRKNEDSLIQVSRETLRKFKIVEKIITKKESNTGRKLTENERCQYISEWFSVAEYTELMNLLNASSLEISYPKNGDIGGIDLLNTKAKPPYMESVSTDPQDEFIAKLDMQDLKNALELVLQKVQDRSRECYRSLFTAYCIDKLVNFEVLAPLLDRKILEIRRKDGEKPAQYEIYMKYHPEVEKKSAEASASKMTKDFLEKLNTALLEKNN